MEVRERFQDACLQRAPVITPQHALPIPVLAHSFPCPVMLLSFLTAYSSVLGGAFFQNASWPPTHLLHSPCDAGRVHLSHLALSELLANLTLLFTRMSVQGRSSQPEPQEACSFVQGRVQGFASQVPTQRLCVTALLDFTGKVSKRQKQIRGDQSDASICRYNINTSLRLPAQGRTLVGRALYLAISKRKPSWRNDVPGLAIGIQCASLTPRGPICL